MKRVKQVIVFMMVSVMAMSLVACGGPSTEKLNEVKTKYNTLADEFNKLSTTCDSMGVTSEDELGKAMESIAKALNEFKNTKFEDMSDSDLDATIKSVEDLTNQLKTQLAPAINALAEQAAAQ